jgi:hypothetical protein
VKGLTVELLRGKHAVATAHVGHVATARHRVVLHRADAARLTTGRYTLVVRHGHTVLVRRRVRLR